MVRAKFKVIGIKRSMGGKYVDVEGSRQWTPCEVQSIQLTPVSGDSEENKKFWAATPGGQIELTCVNADAVAMFDLDGEYYVDFTPAPAAIPQ